MIAGAAKGTIMPAVKARAAGAGEASSGVTPKTTFSGRTDVDAAELVKTPRFQELLQRVRRKKQLAAGKDK